MSVTKNTWPYIDWTTPMSRTRAARLENSVVSWAGRPNSLTSSAPATLKRSVMVEPISALSIIDSRVRRCSLRPTSRAGIRNSGMRTRAMTLTSQDR